MIEEVAPPVNQASSPKEFPSHLHRADIWGHHILVDAILWFDEPNQGREKGLVFGGIVLSIVIEYFVLVPYSFVVV
jgi:hypothetical protein